MARNQLLQLAAVVSTHASPSTPREVSHVAMTATAVPRTARGDVSVWTITSRTMAVTGTRKVATARRGPTDAADVGCHGGEREAGDERPEGDHDTRVH